MARKFPRFIYSNPQNTKSKGPFVVHLLAPRLVFRVLNDNESFQGLDNIAYAIGNLGIVLLDNQPEEYESQKLSLYEKTMEDAVRWLANQIATGEVKL